MRWKRVRLVLIRRSAVSPRGRQIFPVYLPLQHRPRLQLEPRSTLPKRPLGPIQLMQGISLFIYLKCFVRLSNIWFFSRKVAWGSQSEKSVPTETKPEPTTIEPVTTSSAPPMIPPPTEVTGGAPGLQLPSLDLSNQTTQQPTEEKKVIAPPPNLQPQSPPTFDQLANHVQSGNSSLSKNDLKLPTSGELSTQFANGILGDVQPVKVRF